jgi:hypothetical protein
MTTASLQPMAQRGLKILFGMAKIKYGMVKILPG